MEKRRRFNQSTSLRDRIATWAQALRLKAATTSDPDERETLNKKVQQVETAMRLEEWANSPGLQRPK